MLKLTPEQEAKIPEYIEKYIRVASEPIDRSKVGPLLEKIYGRKVTYFVGESIQNIVDLIKDALGGAGKKLGKYDPQLYSQLNSQLNSQLHSQLNSQLYFQLYSQLNSQLYSQLDSQLNSQLSSQLSSQLHSQLRSQLYSQLDSQLRSQLYSQLSNTGWSYYVGIWWTAQLAWYAFGKDIGAELDEDKMTLMNEIVRNVSNVVVFVGDVVFICEKPLVRWENGNMHSDQKMAIEWKDGTGYYALDGVLFEKELWQRVVSKEMSFPEIMKIEIADQRTIALKYNPQAIIKENAKLIHKDNRSNELYLVEGSEINKITEFPKMYFVKMTCPTGRVFIESVPPEEAEKNPNATAMQAWLCGLTKSEYMSMNLES